MAYENVARSGCFKLACRDWQSKNKADKTYENFKKHFRFAARDLKNLPSTEAAGYNQANLVKEEEEPPVTNELITAIAKLAKSSATDRSAMTTYQEQLKEATTAPAAATKATNPPKEATKEYYC